MNVNKNNLLVSEAASGDSTRQALQAVYFDADGTVATSGYILIKIGYPEQVDLTEMPAPIPQGSDKITPFLVSAEACKGLGKAIPKVKQVPALNNLFIDVAATNANDCAHFVATDLESPQSIAIKKLEHAFPPYAQAMPKPEAVTLTIGFDPELMARVCGVAKKMGLENCKFEFTNDKGPCKITGLDKHGQEFTALVMPKQI